MQEILASSIPSPMDLRCLIILFLSLSVMVSESQPISHNSCNSTDMQAAICDMRSKSYYGFAMLLQMLNFSSRENTDWTFLMPSDEDFSAYSITADRLEEFLLRHAIPNPLLFSDLTRLPSGTLVPSALHGELIHIQNHGRMDFFVNNAQVITPNICLNSQVKCHGIDAVLEYDGNPEHIKKHRHRARKAMPKNSPSAPKLKSFSNGHH